MAEPPSSPDDDPFAFLAVAQAELVRAEEPSATSHAPVGPESVIDGAWRLKTTLGRGGFGTVWEAEAVDDPAHVVALKVVSPDPLDDGRWARRFAQEAEVAMALRHPHVVRTLAHGQLSDGARYLVMELLDGDTLRQRLRAGVGLPWDAIAWLLEALGSGLRAVHEAGIVHRDVKPGNLMWVEDDAPPTLKLIDFGLCKGPSALTASAEQVGTLPYVAPEVLREGARGATVAVDVYGMALVAYEVVTGRRAMVAESVPQLVDRILRGPPPRPVPELRADAPAALVRLIEAGLDRDPTARPRDAAEFGRAMASAAR